MGVAASFNASVNVPNKQALIFRGLFYHAVTELAGVMVMLQNLMQEVPDSNFG
jgi:hypothetical protein